METDEFDPIIQVEDPASGSKAFRRETLEKLDFTNIKSDGYSFQIEVI